MLNSPSIKYKPATIINNDNRQWPSKRLTSAPRWCSTDLRDGNQALANPMDQEKKLTFFKHLVECGFKEIEVAFPSASDTDYEFVRKIIDDKLIPEDVFIQVITQARSELIEKTIQSVQGAPKVIVHLYNATAPLFREVVFNKTKDETVALAVDSTKLIKQLTHNHTETQWTLEYSPETFCFTELEFAIEICEKVRDVWSPSKNRPLILNLPATVEVNTPNVYADQIEQFIQNFKDLSYTTISIHPHNDRGTGVASAELALLAGAQRVEGCLFGNGERTGNVDIVTLALNLYTQGIAPNLDFSNIKETIKVAEYCNNIPVHQRHPYAGSLAHTAFSGSHQDAIKKGFKKQYSTNDKVWQIPYLPIDPKDIGCTYQEVIRVNSQSGKSGPSWVLEQDHGLKIPRALQIDFSKKVQNITDKGNSEISASDIWKAFRMSYGIIPKPLLELVAYSSSIVNSEHIITATIHYKGDTITIEGKSNGLLSALINGLSNHFEINLNIKSYSEHTLGSSTISNAISYIECETVNKQSYFGVAINKDTSSASIQATLNAVSNYLSS